LQAANFTILINGTNASSSSFPGNSSGTNITLAAGFYNVSEAAVSGYAANFSADCTGTIASGENRTCTITNDDIAPTLTVIKQVINDNGGTAQSSDFNITVTGTNPSPATFAGSSGGTAVTVDSGTYNITESGSSSYNATFSAGCSGNISIGENRTCIVTNDDKPSVLIVAKLLINDNGGTRNITEFNITVLGNNSKLINFTIFGPHIDNTTIIIMNFSINPGFYNVTELSDPGYLAEFEACTGTILPGSVTICLIFNNDIAPTLTVTKQVINDNGGTASASNFTLFVGAAQVSSGDQNSFDAGTYPITESGPGGYTTTFSGDCDQSGNVTLSVGDVKNCTVTNDDIPPNLTVIKQVINDNGGKAIPANFTINVSGNSPLPATFPGSASGTNVTLDAGFYNVSESGPAGYAANFSSGCSGTISIGETKVCIIINNDIEQLACARVTENPMVNLTIINDTYFNDTDWAWEQLFPAFPSNVIGHRDSGGHPAAYREIKHFPVGDGPDRTGTRNIFTSAQLAPGLLPFLKELHISADTMFQQNPTGGQQLNVDFMVKQGTARLENGFVTTTGVNKWFTNKDTLTRAKLLAAGFNLTGAAYGLDFGFLTHHWWVFPNNTIRVDNFQVKAVLQRPFCPVVCGDGLKEGSEQCDDGNTLDGDGCTSACKAPAKLTVIKRMINNNGGKAVPANFTISVAGNGPAPANFPGNVSGINVTIGVGAYNVSEAGPAGYAANFSAGCSGSIGLNETRTCVIINDDIAPRLTVVKTVINDNAGTKNASNFVLMIDGVQVLNGVPKTLAIGKHVVSEVQQSGYVGTISGACAANGTVYLAIGDNKTCVITNNDI
ncbi:MAG: DUF4215 domain-containing protein, partial [Candidatus Aenigmarchaeota archaeon]|nr:DUF4215 domain-containing protein [Candidatus Aenigmarchaeota archaeon]